LDVQARCRNVKLWSEKFGMRPTIAAVPEDYEENGLTSSPEPYTDPVGKEIGGLFLETPLGGREREMDDNEAARALQELQNHPPVSVQQHPTAPRAGSKRSRPLSLDNSLHDNVREMLRRQLKTETTRSDTVVRSRLGTRMGSESLQVPVRATLNGGRKRLCCSTEAIEPYNNNNNMGLLHPSMSGPAGPGMWEGILN